MPLSQDNAKITTASAAECLAELRRIAETDPTRVITRNFFRNQSRLAESAWNCHYGTFTEYKRAADITLSRHAHGLERHIAKHASVDKLRALASSRHEYAGRYLRPADRRWQTAIVFSDVHDVNCSPFARRVLMDTVSRVRPEKIVINGDLFDLPEFSKHFQDPRAFRLVERIKWVHAFLFELRSCAPEAELILVEGNHEFRLLRHLAEATPALMTVLADLHGYTVSGLLGLDTYQVNYVARTDLTAWTEVNIKQQLRKNYITLWDSLLFGHFPEMARMGFPGSNGHHHRLKVDPYYSPIFGSYGWYQTAAMHRREAAYCNGEKWGEGFLIVHCDTVSRRSQFEYADVSHPGAMVGGKFYERRPDEAVLDLDAVRLVYR